MSPALSSAVDDSAATVAGLGFGKVGSAFSSVMFLSSAVVVAFTSGMAAGGTTSASVVNASSGTSLSVQQEHRWYLAQMQMEMEKDLMQ